MRFNTPASIINASSRLKLPKVVKTHSNMPKTVKMCFNMPKVAEKRFNMLKVVKTRLDKNDSHFCFSVQNLVPISLGRRQNHIASKENP